MLVISDAGVAEAGLSPGLLPHRRPDHIACELLHFQVLIHVRGIRLLRGFDWRELFVKVQADFPLRGDALTPLILDDG